MSKLDPFSMFLRRNGLVIAQSLDDDPPTLGSAAWRIKRLETELQLYLNTGENAGEEDENGEDDK